MPLTPLHVVAALPVKAALARRFSLVMFAGAQGAMDVEPAVRAILGKGELHGWSHTLAGALILGAVTLACKPIAEWLLRWWNQGRPGIFPALDATISWRVSTFSAFVGTFSHVALDGLVHADMRPLMPLSSAKFVSLGLSEMHLYCVVAGGIGALLMIGIRFVRAKVFLRQAAR